MTSVNTIAFYTFMSFVKIYVMTEQLNWMSLECTDVPNKCISCFFFIFFPPYFFSSLTLPVVHASHCTSFNVFVLYACETRGDNSSVVN